MASDSSQSRWSLSASMDDFFSLEGHFFFHIRNNVQAALLGLGLLPPPAACAEIFAGLYRARAGRAADRAVALVVEPVVGNAVLAEVVPHLVLAPRCERIEFLQAVRGVVLALGQLRPFSRMPAALPGNPGPLAGERPLERLDLADLAAALAQLDALIKCIAAVGTHVFKHRRRIRLVDLHVHSVIIFYFLNQHQGIRVQAAGIEHEDLDRQAGARDGVGKDHVFGRKAAGQRGRREFRGDALEACQEGIDFHPERRRKSGTGRATEAWYDSLKSAKPVSASTGSSPSRRRNASKPQLSM